MNNLMIDLETLGTTSDAVILSIGAVKFDLLSDYINPDAFYTAVDIDSNFAAGRTASGSTIQWWMQQDPRAQAVFQEKGMPLEQMLIDLTEWLRSPSEWTVWAKGPSFDITMLDNAFQHFGMTVPWKFWNVRCVRTYENLPGAKSLRGKDAGVGHNALNDAYKQAQTIQRIHEKLFIEQPRSSMIKAKKP